MEERRKYPRIVLPLDVRWPGMSGNSSSRLSDISLGGCYVESLAVVSEGDVAEFSIRLPGGMWLDVRGQVICKHEGLGFGLKFVDLGEDVLRTIAEIIASRI